MKALTAAFTTALLVFVVASAMSEMLASGETSHPQVTADRTKLRDANSDNAGVKLTHSASKRKRLDPKTEKTVATNDSVPSQTLEFERQLSTIRQRESELKARQDALSLVFQEIRSEQQSVEQIRQQVSSEIAELQDAAVKVAQRDSLIPTETAASAANRDSAFASARPAVSLRDTQAVQDAAVLVRRLAEQGSFRAATSLLREMKDRDAAKVLATLATTDSRIASRLSETLQAERAESRERR